MAMKPNSAPPAKETLEVEANPITESSTPNLFSHSQNILGNSRRFLEIMYWHKHCPKKSLKSLFNYFSYSLTIQKPCLRYKFLQSGLNV